MADLGFDLGYDLGRSLAPGVAVVDPSDLASVTAWMRSTEGVTGDPADSWASKVGGLTFAGFTTARPDVVPAGQNGLQVLRSDGSNDTMGSLTPLSSIISNSGWTIHCAFKAITVGANRSASYQNDPIINSPGWWGLHLKGLPGGDGDTVSLILHNWDGAEKTCTVSYKVGEWAVITGYWDGSDMSLTIESASNNETGTAPSVGAVATQTANMTIFKSNVTEYANLDVGEIVTQNIYDAANAAGVRAGMKADWQ